jgi:hypothetical protein
VPAAVQLAPKPYVLYNFNSQKVVDQWHVFTDSFFGGKSEASLTFNQEEQVGVRTAAAAPVHLKPCMLVDKLLHQLLCLHMDVS